MSFPVRYLRNRISLVNNKGTKFEQGYNGYCFQLLRSFTGYGIPKKPESTETDPDGFRILKIPGLHKSENQVRKEKFTGRQTAVPREKRLPVDVDWTDVWPTAATFNPSVIPLPIRQGFVDNASENHGLIPYKYGNTELLKIPNFFHLTPKHIKKHCAAIKKFCTAWPKGLSTEDDIKNHFPVTVTTQDYILAGPSVRDPRARTVTVKFHIDSLQLDEHAKDKMVRLLGERYERTTGVITLVSDSCPIRKQNQDYINYLITALYYESWKTEGWEAEKSWADLKTYDWQKSKAKDKINSLLDECHKNKDDLNWKKERMEEYGKAVESLHNDGENEYTLSQYKNAVLKLL